MTIQDLYNEVSKPKKTNIRSAEWVKKMMHPVLDAPVFDRADYLIKACRNKTILDVGASDPMSSALAEVAGRYNGAGINPEPDPRWPSLSRSNYTNINLDKAQQLPEIKDLQIIVAGEIIEHLSNAGNFLDLLHTAAMAEPVEARAQVILTTPNAFSKTGRRWSERKTEIVNPQHVAWYSYHTLKVLVERHGFRILLWAWYNGQPMTAEGLIFHLQPESK